MMRDSMFSDLNGVRMTTLISEVETVFQNLLFGLVQHSSILTYLEHVRFTDSPKIFTAFYRDEIKDFAGCSILCGTRCACCIEGILVFGNNVLLNDVRWPTPR